MFAQALTGKFDAVGVVDEAIQHGVGDRGITDHRRIPHFLMGIYLTSRLQTLVTVFTGSVLS